MNEAMFPSIVKYDSAGVIQTEHVDEVNEDVPITERIDASDTLRFIWTDQL